jgi:ribonuclease HII
MPSFEIEDTYPGRIVAGVDEAGLGPMAGPIVVCSCVIQDRTLIDPSIDDSKKLSRATREKLFPKIVDNFIYGIAVIAPHIIDEYGLSHAWERGIREAVQNIPIKPDVIIIDGNKKVIIEGITTESIIKGDSKSYSIAAASIIAKVTRDRIMCDLHKEYPEYGFNKHVGYCTKAHIEALRKFGVTDQHRKSYAPVKAQCETVE